jgi:hypothetical protein
VSSDGSLESQPLYKLGLWVTGIVDGAIGSAVALFDRAMQNQTDLIPVLAAIGLICAALAWVFGTVFARLNRPVRPAPAAAAPAVVIQTGRSPRVSRAAPPRRSGAGTRPKRRARRRGSNPLLRWLRQE